MKSFDDIDGAISDSIMSEDVRRLKRFIKKHSVDDPAELGSWLTLASMEGKIESLKLLIELGADVNYSNEDGETPFSFSCARAQLRSAKILYEHGANINSVDSSGGTPLDWAVCWTPPEFRSWLRSVGGVRKRTFDEWPWPPVGGLPD